MEDQNELIEPGEQIIYSCKKEWQLFIILFFFGVIAAVPLFLIAISKKLPLEVQVIMLTFAFGYWIVVILALRENRRSYLILTNHRILLRRGIFGGEAYSFLLESIRKIEPVRKRGSSMFYIHTTDGRKINVLYPFHWNTLEEWARHVNALRGGTVYAEPTDKGKPTILQQIAMALLILFMFSLVYFYTQSLEEGKKANVIKQKLADEMLQEKKLKRERAIKTAHMSAEYKNITAIENTPGKQPEERIRLWKEFLRTHKDDIPGNAEDDRLKINVWEKIISLQSQLPPGNPLRGVRLRSTFSANLREEDCHAMVEKYDFFDRERNEDGNSKRQYQVAAFVGNPVVLDYATGLMWHPTGSEHTIPYKKIHLWLEWLNRKGYAGFRDWRLPTLEEAASLLVNSPKNQKCHIDEVFSTWQGAIFTGDQSINRSPFEYTSKYVWVVSYCGSASCIIWRQSGDSYVRPVRSR